MSANRIVMAGCHELGQYLLPRLAATGLAPSSLVTISPAVAARHAVAGYVDLRPLAVSLGIDIHEVQTYDLSAAGDVSFFQDSGFDLLIQGGWQRLFPPSVLASLRIGAVGVHGSADLLPKGRGRSPLNWSLIEGRRRFLFQFFLMEEGVDDGPIFDVADVDITPFDTIRTLYYKNALVTARVLSQSIPALLNGTATFRPQHGEPTFYARRTAADGRIDWEGMDVWQIHDLVRALTRPYPGAFGRLDGKDHRVWRAQIFDTRILYPDRDYGDVVERFGDVLIVNCRGGLLLVDDHELLTEPGP
jgi:methionyl-tRNA formyltransferase